MSAVRDERRNHVSVSWQFTFVNGDNFVEEEPGHVAVHASERAVGEGTDAFPPIAEPADSRKEEEE